MTLHQLKLQ